MMSKITRRRILIPIDIHGIHREALEQLVRIARQLDRDLLGLLLEDIRLQRAAELPFATEITLTGARERSLLRDHLLLRHNLVTNDARRLLNELADRDRVGLSFEHASGHRLHSALEREGEVDIFFPARQRWHVIAATRRLGGPPIRRLGLVLAQGPQDELLLLTARALLEAGLVGDVYVVSPVPPLGEQLDPLYRPGHRVCVQSNMKTDADSITRLIRHSPYDLLLLPRSCLAPIASETLDEALEKSGGQVLVIN
jgi:hypothetical protein